MLPRLLKLTVKLSPPCGIVAYEEEKTDEETREKPNSHKSSTGLVSRMGQLFNHDRSSGNEVPPSGRQHIIGFAGFWIMANEAHISSIAVQKPYRYQGIGELLLISTIDLATELNARIITLEVRISNTTAQSLYQKYGFIQVGLRRGYYIDNNEDAVAMSATNIGSASFQAHLNRLKQVHSRKWGIALYQIAR